MRRTPAAVAALVTLVTALVAAPVAAAGGGQTTTTTPSSTLATPSAPPSTGPPAPPTAPAKDKPVALTPSATTRVIPFDLERKPKSITLTYRATTPIPTGAVVDVAIDDLDGSHDVFPASQITTTASVIGNGTRLKIVASLDPKDVKSGTYRGQLRLASTAVTAPPVALTVTLSEHSRSGYFLAFLVIAFGVLCGLATKWLSDTGAKLGALRARLTDLTVDLQALAPGTLPPDLALEIARARRMLSRSDAAGAQSVIDELTAGEVGLFALSHTLTRLDAEVARQRAALEQATLDAQARGKAEVACAHEERWREDLCEGGWPHPEASKDDQQKKLGWAEAYSEFLNAYIDADANGQAALREALNAFARGDFAKGVEIQASAQSQPPQASGVAPGAGQAALAIPPSVVAEVVRQLDAGEGEQPAQAASGRWPRFLGFLADHAGLLGALLLGVLVTLVGLNELYSKHPDAGQSIADWIGFFAWGFAIELTGITAAQAALRLAPSPPA